MKELIIKDINNCLEALVKFDEDAKRIFRLDEVLKEDLERLKRYRNN